MRATKRLSKLLDRFEDEIISKAEKEKSKLQVNNQNHFYVIKNYAI